MQTLACVNYMRARHNNYSMRDYETKLASFISEHEAEHQRLNALLNAFTLQNQKEHAAMMKRMDALEASNAAEHDRIQKANAREHSEFRAALATKHDTPLPPYTAEETSRKAIAAARARPGVNQRFRPGLSGDVIYLICCNALSDKSAARFVDIGSKVGVGSENVFF